MNRNPVDDCGQRVNKSEKKLPKQNRRPGRIQRVRTLKINATEEEDLRCEEELLF